MKRLLIPAVLLCLCAPAVWAQSGKPLDLKLPPQDIPPTSTTGSTGSAAPGVYYGDTSGATGEDSTAQSSSQGDDKRVHGSISTGIGYGKGIGTTQWNAASISVNNALGDSSPVDLGISISVMNAQNLGGSHWHDH